MVESTRAVKNPKRLEAGKKLSEKNKEVKEFYIKNSKYNKNDIIIGVALIGKHQKYQKFKRQKILVKVNIFYMSEFQKRSHTAIITESTDCGNTCYVINLLLKVWLKEYFNYFDIVIVICQTFLNNDTYMKYKYLFNRDKKMTMKLIFTSGKRKNHL